MPSSPSTRMLWHFHFTSGSENHPDLPSATFQRAGVRAKLHLNIKPGLAHQHLFDFTVERGKLGKDCEPLQPHSICLNPPCILHLLSHNTIKQLELKIKQMTWRSPKRYISISTCCTSFLLVRIFCPPAEGYPQHNQNRYIKWSSNLMQLFYPAKEVISRTLSRPGFKGMLSQALNPTLEKT